LSLPTEREPRRRIQAAHDYIFAKKWPEAVSILQPLLDRPEDCFIIDPHQKMVSADTPTAWVSLRAEAENLLASMPPEGRKVYQDQMGGVARSLLQTAQVNNDRRLLGEVVRRYGYTEAGLVALDALGTYHLDRGRYGPAAACYQQLVKRASAPLDPRTLYRASLAFQLAGDTSQAEQCWRRLAARAPEGVRLGTRQVGLDELHKELKRLVPLPERSLGWSVFRGDLSRANTGQAALPFLEPRWEWASIDESTSLEWIEKYQKQRAEAFLPVLPGAFPLVVGGKLIFRGQGSIQAVDLRTGLTLWKRPTLLGLDVLVHDSQHVSGPKVSIEDWLQKNADPAQQLLENSVLGTLSSDGYRVYFVDDLPVRPPQQPPPGPGVRVVPQGPFSVSGELYFNRLRAIDLATGAPLWEVGGRGKGDLQDAFFLGSPMPLQGGLYCLVEKKGELRLFCLDAETGKPNWSQLIAILNGNQTAFDRLLFATHCSHADGILVCPTDNGTLVGIDLFQQRLAWACSYPVPNNGDGTDADGSGAPVEQRGVWRGAAPIIQDGKVLYTPRDADLVCCLNLRDGKTLWTAERGDDLYLGCVHDGKVLLIGQHSCRALGLADGKTIWQRASGVPSGLGVASGSAYYLPLQEGAVAVLSVDTGEELARFATRGPAPGNLVFHEGDLFTQTAEGVIAYEQFKVKLAQLDARVAQRPDDVTALGERARLHLSEGKPRLALADLRQALAHRPAEEASAQLHRQVFQALSDLLRAKLPANEREAVEREVAQEWKTLQSSEDDELLRQFVTLFDPQLAEGAEARLRLAQCLTDQGRTLEAELLLLDLRDQSPTLAPRALEALARLYVREGLLEDAIACYRELGLSQAQFAPLAGLAADKRFLPYLTDPALLWQGGQVNVQELHNNHSLAGTRWVTLDPEGPVGPFYRRYRLGLDCLAKQFVLFDTRTGTAVWRLPIASDSTLGPLMNQFWLLLVQQLPEPSTARLPCTVRGHLLVLNLGMVVCGIDLMHQRLLWQHDMSGQQQINQITFQNNQLMIIYGDGRVSTRDLVGQISAQCVCLKTESGLVGLDPLRGTVRWNRNDLATLTDAFGDAQYVYVVEQITNKMNEAIQVARRAVRLRDGQEVAVEDFTDTYQTAQSKFARRWGRLLLVDELEAGKLILFDPQTSKDVWSKTFPNGARQVQSEGNTVAVLSPDGVLTVLDGPTGKLLLKVQVDVGDLSDINELHLLEDSRHFYLVCSRPLGQFWSLLLDEPSPNVMFGLTCVPVNGPVIALDRDTGAEVWSRTIHNHQILVERLDEMPFLLLTAVTPPQQPQEQKQVLMNGIVVNQNVVLTKKLSTFTAALDKMTGRWVYTRKEPAGPNPAFYGLYGDPRSGCVELVSGDRVVQFLHALTE
jgi:outer membrane protein assembly factor BamB